MSAPPPRPPPPSSPRHIIGDQDPQSRPCSAEFGSSIETNQRGSRERERSNTYSAPGCHSRSPPTKSLNPPTPPPTPTHPTPSSRHTSSSPPPSLPTVAEGEGDGGKGKGSTVKKINTNSRQRPVRPPPPALRARSLPRGLSSIPGGGLKIWEQVNGNIGRNHSKSSDNIPTTLQDGSNSQARTDMSGPNSVPNGDHILSLAADHTTKRSASDDVTANTTTGQPGGTDEAADPNDLQSHAPVTTLPEATPTSDQPVIPPRPYRPPRPFAPPSGSSSSSHSPGSKHRNRTHHGDTRHKVPSQPALDTRSNSVGGEKRPDVIGRKSRDATPSDDVTPHHDVSSRNESTSHDVTPPPSMPSNPECVTGNVERGENQSRTLYDVNTSTASPKKSPRSGSKSQRLFKSMRKGISKMRHKNVRSSSVPTLRPLQGGGEVIGHDKSALNEIEEEETYPDPLPQGIVDPLVVLCVAYLNRDSVLREAGLFRIPGDFATVKKIRSDYIRGEPINLMQVLDPHTVAGIMKYHFREWRVSIIPRGKPLEAITAAVRDKDEEGVRQVLHGLSQDNLATLRMVAELLSKVVEYSEWNKMTSGTLATSCGPSFFPYLPPSPANTLLKFMIDHCATLFPE